MRKAMPGVKCGIARVNDELRPLFPEAVRAIVATASATTEPVVLRVLLYADEGAAPALVEVSWEPAMMTPDGERLSALAVVALRGGLCLGYSLFLSRSLVVAVEPDLHLRLLKVFGSASGR